uniref:Phosphopantetheine--protein transferase domain-containing protein n=1 Tax=Candidatus Kentrum sp. TC TaxID=2126339 RepID=A0A450ZA02_9GAMM|nr:MAG: phosphopantetheine--protein transferase domain-containing protein [Candidatus Kentron sp. TC]VFK50603.1 MAG: phosphopantetheine--protein transferase domain-containing protein [Candidatus Kentron sp. TC]
MGCGGAGIQGDSLILGSVIMGFSSKPITVSEPFRDGPRADLALSGDEIHVWRASLDLPDIPMEVLRETLDKDELQRAERFRFPEQRRRFIVARGILRMLLARYLRKPAVRITFEYNRYGKPFLREEESNLHAGVSPDSARTFPGRDDVVQFNLSHSKGMVLYAFSLDRRVGIDIEWVRRKISDTDRIVARFFSPREAKILLGVPEHCKKDAFFGCWTRKEAYIKARGKGLSIPLDRFEVIPTSGEMMYSSGSANSPGRTESIGCHDGMGRRRVDEAVGSHPLLFGCRAESRHGGCDAWRLVRPVTLTAHDGSRQATWGIRTFDVGNDYMAAVAVEGEGWLMKRWQWRGI